MHRNEITSQQGFIDNVILIAMIAVAARACCLLYSDALSEFAMSAHPVKSVQILAGRPEWVEAFQLQMEDEPCKLQGFEVKQAKAKRYLGMYFISATYKETNNFNIRKKHGVIQAVASEIRNICEMPQIKSYGKIAVGGSGGERDCLQTGVLQKTVVGAPAGPTHPHDGLGGQGQVHLARDAKQHLEGLAPQRARPPDHQG